MSAVAERFSLDPSEPPKSSALIGPPLGVTLKYWWPELAKEAFLTKFHRLTEQRSSAGGCQ